MPILHEFRGQLLALLALFLLVPCIVGAPVNDAACVYSDGVTRAVEDAMAMKTVKSTIIPWPDLVD